MAVVVVVILITMLIIFFLIVSYSNDSPTRHSKNKKSNSKIKVREIVIRIKIIPQ